jgi:hypothetical protein
MGKFVIFTNASTAFDGESIAINKEIIASVFESAKTIPNQEARTVIYGVNNIDWHVKESYLEVLARLNAD